MKLSRLIAVLFAIPLAWGIAFADIVDAEPGVQVEKESKVKYQQCPKTLMTEQCLHCHVAPRFTLKEQNPHAAYDYPSSNVRFLFDRNGKPEAGYLLLETISSTAVQDFLDYVDRYGVRHAIVEIHSPGGSLFDAYKIVGVFRHRQAQGMVIETRCYGFAASAGFLVLISGSAGHRFVAPQAEIMWHELVTFELFKLSSPADKEDEAKVLRHLQDTAHEWISEVSRVSKAKIDELVRKKEFWQRGTEAVKIGFADELLAVSKK